MTSRNAVELCSPQGDGLYGMSKKGKQEIWMSSKLVGVLVLVVVSAGCRVPRSTSPPRPCDICAVCQPSE